MKRVLFLLLILLGTISLYAQYCPKCKYKVEYNQYTVDWDKEARIPRFVYYTVEYDKIGNYGRYSFGADVRVENTSYPEDYYDSSYDKGHLFPAASAHSWRDASESFWMTNMAPQLPSLNRGVWKSIETWERNMSDSIIHVVAGYIPDRGLKKMYGTKITVPKRFFKVIYNPKYNLMIGFIVRQNESRNYKDCIVTVDEIERLTGIDFFYQLPDGVEEELESFANIWYWY
jgi:endonuclease G